MGDSVAAIAIALAASQAEGSDECCSPQPPSHRGSTGSPSPVGVKQDADENEKQERKRRRVLRVGITLLREQIEEMEKVIHVMERELLEGSDSESS